MHYLDQAATPTATTPSEPIPGAGQVPNSAGGHGWQVDSMVALRRFLILGLRGSFYESPEVAVGRAPEVVLAALAGHGVAAVDEIVGLSVQGRAQSNSEALYALAVASAHHEGALSKYALARLGEVARTGSHLLEFVAHARRWRGGGRALNEALRQWYLGMPEDKLALQLVKYRNRHGWTHRDVLRLCRPRPRTRAQEMLFAFAVKGWEEDVLPRIAVPDDPQPGKPEADARALLIRFAALQGSASPRESARLLAEGRMPREALLSEHVSEPEVQTALLRGGMPLGALLRNLANLTRAGVLKPLSRTAQDVASQITDEAAIQAARAHPVDMLKALAAYRLGASQHGREGWNPVPEVLEALERGFYLAFRNVEPTGARQVLAVDCSGSMDFPQHHVAPGLSCREAAAAMLMVTARSGDPFVALGFSGGFSQRTLTVLPIHSSSSLEDAVAATHDIRFGATALDLPYEVARKEGWEADAFVTYTDNEVNAGRSHPAQSLAEYRASSGIQARGCVVGMVANEVSIADPRDPLMMDVEGFDAGAPAALADFIGGRL